MLNEYALCCYVICILCVQYYYIYSFIHYKYKKKWNTNMLLFIAEFGVIRMRCFAIWREAEETAEECQAG